jgi:hypothetical protein
MGLFSLADDCTTLQEIPSDVSASARRSAIGRRDNSLLGAISIETPVAIALPNCPVTMSESGVCTTHPALCTACPIALARFIHSGSNTPYTAIFSPDVPESSPAIRPCCSGDRLRGALNFANSKRARFCLCISFGNVKPETLCFCVGFG